MNSRNISPKNWSDELSIYETAILTVAYMKEKELHWDIPDTEICKHFADVQCQKISSRSALPGRYYRLRQWRTKNRKEIWWGFFRQVPRGKDSMGSTNVVVACECVNLTARANALNTIKEHCDSGICPQITAVYKLNSGGSTGGPKRHIEKNHSKEFETFKEYVSLMDEMSGYNKMLLEKKLNKRKKVDTSSTDNADGGTPIRRVKEKPAVAVAEATVQKTPSSAACLKSPRVVSQKDTHQKSAPSCNKGVHPVNISDLELYTFDTLGYLVVRNILSADEVAQVNKAIDQNMGSSVHREGPLRLTTGERAVGSGSQLRGDGKTGRLDLGGVLKWGGLPLRSILAHPKLIPYFHAFVGEGYRLDHEPITIIQNSGAEGFDMHGGALDNAGRFDHFLAYHYSHGSIRTQLLGCSVQLVDTCRNDGGFAVIPGSHKSNFKCPSGVKKMQYEEFSTTQEQQTLTVSPEVRAGDVILFSEACTHGTLAWNSEKQRRIVLFRFSPANVAYGRNYSEPKGGWDSTVLPSLTAEMKTALQPPFHPRLDREQVSISSGQVKASIPVPRSELKKDFDKQVFGTTYF